MDELPPYVKLSRAFNGFDESYAINASTERDLSPTAYLSSKKDVVAKLLRVKVAELKNIKVSWQVLLDVCRSLTRTLFCRFS